MAERQAAARLHEPGVALGQGERDAGGHQRAPAAGRERGVLAGQHVEPGVADARVGGQRKVGIEADHGDDEAVRHPAEARRLSYPHR